MARTYRSGTRTHTVRTASGRTVQRRGHVRQRPVHHLQPRRAGRNAVRSYRRARRGHYWVAGAIASVVVLELGGWALLRIVGAVVLAALVAVIVGHRWHKSRRQDATRESAT